MPKFTFTVPPKLKKLATYLAAMGAITLVMIPQLRADTTTDASGASSTASIYLQQIAATTNSILTAVTSPLNPVVGMLLECLTNLIAADTATNPASPTPALQMAFTNLNFINSTFEPMVMKSNLAALQNDFFTGITSANLPNANDLSFGSLINQPYLSPDPRTQSGGSTVNAPYNYMKNAAGINITHVLPGTDWKGTQNDQAKYTAYYNAVSAVQTFNGYALSQLYFDSMLSLNASQNALVTQVSDATNWFATVTSETIGAVLRQILVFESQSYVVLTEILQTEKLALAATTMNNTLLIAGNGMSEGMLVTKAAKKMPSTNGS